MEQREFKAEEWLHKCDRSKKRDGKPLFDGKKWYCSRCEGGYYVNVNGCSQAEAEQMFWTYLADVCFTRVYSVMPCLAETMTQSSDEFDELLGDFSSDGT